MGPKTSSVGTGFFTVEVLTLKELKTYYVLFFIQLGKPEDLSSRRHTASGSGLDGTDGAQCHDGGNWLSANCRYLLHDRDSKYSPAFCQLIKAEKVKTLALPPQSPNLNAYAERWVRSIKEECLSKLILFGEGSLKRALHHYEIHYHQDRNHQGKNNLLLFPPSIRPRSRKRRKRRCLPRVGGLLKYYERRAA